MILDEIMKYRARQLEREKAACGLEEMQKRAEKALAERKPVSLKAALRQDTLSCICEVKKASPSKGLIRADFQPVEIAKAYEAAGANAISCLTEEHFFDAYQVYEAAAIGADAVLLIAAVLPPETLAELYRLAYLLGLEVLVEVHNQEELEQIAFLEPQILGVNNRNLKTFEVSLDTVAKLKPFAPEQGVFVSESGIRNNADMQMVRQLGADAVLIGETLMRAKDRTAALNELRRGCIL